MPESALYDLHATRSYGPVLPRRLIPVPPKKRKHVKLRYDHSEGRGQRQEAEDRARMEMKVLADNECKHGHLPHDPLVTCLCWSPA